MTLCLRVFVSLCSTTDTKTQRHKGTKVSSVIMPPLFDFPVEVHMRGCQTAAIALLCFVLSTSTLAQTSNATLGGTVSDSTGALIPGVTITATNTGTGIVTTVLT